MHQPVNIPERSSQVAMIAQVYEGTGAVLVWVGPSSKDSHLAMGLLVEICLNKFADDYILESVRKRDNFRGGKPFPPRAIGITRTEYGPPQRDFFALNKRPLFAEKTPQHSQTLLRLPGFCKASTMVRL